MWLHLLSYSLLILRSSSQISFSTYSNLPELGDYSFTAENLVAATVDDVMYLFFDHHTDGGSDVAKTYKKTINGAWTDITVNAPDSSYDLHCDYVTCTTVIDNRYIYVYLFNNDASRIFIYDTDSSVQQWLGTSIAVTNTADWGACITSDGSSYIYLIGGFSGNYIADDQVLRYDIDNQQWSSFNGMQEPAWYGSCVYYEDSIYYFAGFEATSQYPSRSVQVFNTNNNLWVSSSSNSVIPSRTHFRAILHNDLVYIIGGYTYGGSYFDTVYRYNPSTNLLVSPTSTMSTDRKNPMVIIMNNQIIICGGQIASSTYTTTCEISNQQTIAPTGSMIYFMYITICIDVIQLLCKPIFNSSLESTYGNAD